MARGSGCREEAYAMLLLAPRRRLIQAPQFSLAVIYDH